MMILKYSSRVMRLDVRVSKLFDGLIKNFCIALLLTVEYVVLKPKLDSFTSFQMTGRTTTKPLVHIYSLQLLYIQIRHVSPLSWTNYHYICLKEGWFYIKHFLGFDKCLVQSQKTCNVVTNISFLFWYTESPLLCKGETLLPNFPSPWMRLQRNGAFTKTQRRLNEGGRNLTTFLFQKKRNA